MAQSKKTGSEIVTVDRRATDRRNQERRVGEATDASVKAMIAAEKKKAKVQRRRQIDPTTCERDYSADEVEFMGALENYKRANGRMFPTCSEILEVIRGLGYTKSVTAAQVDATVDAIDSAISSSL
jgi:hypothetical protein